MKSVRLFEILHVDLNLIVDYFGQIEGFCKKDNKFYYFSGYDIDGNNVSFDNDEDFCIKFCELDDKDTEKFKKLNKRETDLIGKIDKYCNLMNEYYEIESEIDSIRTSAILGDGLFFEKICKIDGDFINWWNTPTYLEVIR